MTTRRLRWGIIGTAKIAREFLVPAIRLSPYAEVMAVASRDGAQARRYADQCDIPRCYGSYQDLLNDPDIDAVYVPLPNDMHVSLSLQAIAAGKHVLCEKPLGLNAKDIQPLLAAAEARPELVVMEAFMYRYHPQWVRVKRLVDEGVLGQINAVEACFTYFNDEPDNVRNNPDLGGGGMLDIGCYCVSVARWIFDREPRRVSGQLDMDPAFGVDRHASGLLDFAPGMATFFCSTQSYNSQQVKITGTRGQLVVENPFFARRDTPSRLLLSGETDDIIVIGEPNQYLEQINAFSLAALEGRPAPTPLSDALGNMRAVDGIFAAATLGRWVELD